MKKFLTVALVALLVVVVMGTMGLAAKYKDGEYIGFAANDKQGHVVVAVGIVKGFITNVEIVSPVKHIYTHEQGKKAFYEFPGKVIAKQAAGIDTVAGATSSYKEYNAAVQMALDIAAGTYKGTKFYGLARDYGHGHVVLEVTLNSAKNKIEAVKFITSLGLDSLKDRDTLVADKAKGYPYAAGKTAFETFPGKVLKAQNVHVDGVSGATHSNAQFEHALSQALEGAGVLANFEKK